MDIMDSRIEAYMKQIPVLAEAAAGRSRYRMRQGGWNVLRLIWPRFFLRRLPGMA